MRKPLLICGAALLATATATPLMAAPWVRGYAVDNYEPAFYYGAKAGGTEGQGSDCPKGTVQDNNYKAILKTAWRTDAEVAEITKPVAVGKDPFAAMSQPLAHRGFRKDIDTYINPFAAPDPGIQEVTGKIAEGFNLDGDAKTGGFTAPGGERGVDNGFYRAWGCIMSYRGTAYHAYLSQRANDKMLDGLYTMVIRVSGSKDPRNDDNAIVEIAYSPDHVVKDANGRVITDYSFRVVKDAQYTKLKAHIKNGVVETEQAAVLRAPEFSWGETNRGEAAFQKGKLRFTIAANGAVTGLVGGYRDWRDLYSKDTFNVPSEGPTRETYYHENQIAMYYALKRNADGIPDARTGQNTAISAAYRFTAVPAYVVDSARPVAIDEPPYPTGARAYKERALFIKATSTKTISPELVRRRGEFDELAPHANDAAPSKPGLQVNNDAPGTVASATR